MAMWGNYGDENGCYVNDKVMVAIVSTGLVAYIASYILYVTA